MKRSRPSDATSSSSAPPEPIEIGEYEPLTFEEALAEARPRPNATAQRKELFVGNLDRRVTEYMVVSVFSKHGKIVKYEYLWNKTGPRRGLPRGCCFIEYSTPEEAQAAKDAIHGKKMLGRPVVVRFTDERVVSTTGAAPRRSTSAVTQREPPKPPSIDKLEAVYDAKIHEIEHHLDSLKKSRK